MTGNQAGRGTALITGGSRGIGAAAAIALAEDGWDVGLSYRTRADEAAAVVAACEKLGRRAVAVPAEVSEPADIERLFDTVTSELGKLGAVINNAGVNSPTGRVADYDLARLERVFRINSTGAFLGDRQHLLPGRCPWRRRRVRRLRGQQGGGGCTHRRAGERGGRRGNPRTRGAARPDRDRDPRARPVGPHRHISAAGPSRSCRGGGRGNRVPRVRPVVVHDRDVGRRGRRSLVSDSAQ
jgi:NAD(P)-dependent dehydrogenase (short-subunit alcohol dehydrogenase family)